MRKLTVRFSTVEKLHSVFFERLVSDAMVNQDAKHVPQVTLLIWSVIHGCAKLKMDGIFAEFIDVEEFEAVLVRVASNGKIFER